MRVALLTLKLVYRHARGSRIENDFPRTRKDKAEIRADQGGITAGVNASQALYVSVQATRVLTDCCNDLSLADLLEVCNCFYRNDGVGWLIPSLR